MQASELPQQAIMLLISLARQHGQLEVEFEESSKGDPVFRIQAPLLPSTVMATVISKAKPFIDVGKRGCTVSIYLPESDLTGDEINKVEGLRYKAQQELKELKEQEELDNFLTQ